MNVDYIYFCTRSGRHLNCFSALCRCLSVSSAFSLLPDLESYTVFICCWPPSGLSLSRCCCCCCCCRCCCCCCCHCWPLVRPPCVNPQPTNTKPKSPTKKRTSFLSIGCDRCTWARYWRLARHHFQLYAGEITSTAENNTREERNKKKDDNHECAPKCYISTYDPQNDK